jgi:hypothetical protein
MGFTRYEAEARMNSEHERRRRAGNDQEGDQALPAERRLRVETAPSAKKPPRPRGEGGTLERTLGRPGVQGCDREMHTDRHASYEASSMAPICNRVHPAWFEKDRVGCVRVGRLVCPCCGCLARGGYERRRRRRRHLDLGRVRCLLERELRRFPYAGCQRIVR